MDNVHYTPIPNGPIIWLLVMRINLHRKQKLKLKLSIIKQKLDISLAESVVSLPIASEHVIGTIATSTLANGHLRPK